MITRVEGISDGQLWRISQMIGEAFVSNFRRACSSECFHRFPIAGICNEGTRRGSSLGLDKNARAIRFYERHGFIAAGEKKPEDGTSEYLVLLKKKG